MRLQAALVIPLVFVVAVGLIGCASEGAEVDIGPSDDPTQPLRFGAEVLADRDFDILYDKRVGLIANHTALVDTSHLIDLLHAHPRVSLVALFGPEHGLRGLEEAGDQITDGVDETTGIPVYSLYGEHRAPPDSVLAGLDVLVFDIQDIGARFYTYISTMGLAMQSAAAAGVPFVVLDRPNPLGRRSEGPIREPEFDSFIGMFPIPMAHGLTVGEIARNSKQRGWLEGLEQLELTIVEVAGWNHEDLWPETRREWIATSPNIPDFETALVYPGTVLFEGTTWSEGRGTDSPFMLIGYPGIDGKSMAEALNARSMTGVSFEAATFTPESMPGKASNPKHNGVEISGVRLTITDYRAYDPVTSGIEIVRAAYRATPETNRAEFFDARWFDLLTGTSTVRERLLAEALPDPND